MHYLYSIYLHNKQLTHLVVTLFSLPDGPRSPGTPSLPVGHANDITRGTRTRGSVGSGPPGVWPVGPQVGQDTVCLARNTTIKKPLFTPRESLLKVMLVCSAEGSAWEE